MTEKISQHSCTKFYGSDGKSYCPTCNPQAATAAIVELSNRVQNLHMGLENLLRAWTCYRNISEQDEEDALAILENNPPFG